MVLSRSFILICLAAGASAGQQRGMHMPAEGQPKVELKGTIERVRIGRGQGMPSIEVKNAAGVTRVILGSVRYLIEQDFNPKAGDQVTVKGWKSGADIVAASVTIGGKTVTLRDDQGRPVWMGRHRGPPAK